MDVNLLSNLKFRDFLIKSKLSRQNNRNKERISTKFSCKRNHQEKWENYTEYSVCITK